MYIPHLMKYYKCDPSWPICLYDFTHRNLNPKFNTLKVAKPLNSYVVEEHFSQQKLSRKNPVYKLKDEVNNMNKSKRNPASKTAKATVISPTASTSVSEADLVIQRSMHLCSLPQYRDFQEKFKTRYDALDPSLFNNDKVRFDVDDELDAVEKARLFVADVC